MAEMNTTRRALLGAATTALAYAGGAAIVGGAAAVASEAKGATIAGDRSTWGRALAAYHAASKASDDHWARVEKPAWDHLQSKYPHPGRSFTVPEVYGMRASLHWYDDKPDAYEGCVAEVRDAARAHRAKIEAHSAACERLQFARIRRESDEHLERIFRAEQRLFETPAPDLAAVAVKLDLLWADEREAMPTYNELVLADVRRLTGEAL